MPHVLFIDDHEMLLQSLRLTLEHEYTVSMATSVPEAFELMAKRIPDIIGVDYLMPDLDGLDFLEMVKHKIARPKVIFFPGCSRTAWRPKPCKPGPRRVWPSRLSWKN
jgi:CheY-like chemotaxis protein